MALSRALAFSLLLLAAAAFAQDPPSLVRNPSMEDLTENGFARDWSGGEFGKPGANVITDDTVAHTGQRSIRLGVNLNSFVICTAAAITAKPNTKYYVVWWCKTQGLTQARAYLWLQTDEAQRVLPEDNQYGTQDWTRYIREYTTTDAETSLAPVLTTHDSGGGECHAWFDDVAVYEGALPAALAAEHKRYQRNLQGISNTAVIVSRKADITIWADNLAARVYREDGVPDYAETVPAATLSLARNEQNYLQAVLTPKKELADVTLRPSDLKGPGVIPAAQVRWWRIGYVNVQQTQQQATRKGWTPDPLLKPGPTTAPAGQNTPFLIGVTSATNTKPGLYRGSVTVLSAGKPIDAIPLAVTVYDFTLPKDPTFRTLITYSPTEFTKWDQRPLLDIEKDICNVLYAHRIRGNGATAVVDASIVDGQVVCDFTSFDAKIGWTLGDLGFNAFFLGPCFGGGTGEAWEKHALWLGMKPLSDDFNRLFPEYMRQVGQHLREKGWLDEAYLYLWDEPEVDYFDKVVALQKLALQGDPDFKIWETTSPNYREFWNVVKAWSVPFSRPHFSEESVEARRQAGDEIWVYNIPATLEAPTQVHRLWFWQAARYGAVGAQLWSVTFYHGIDPWENPTPVPYPVGRDGTQLYYYDAGQAIMIYPDKAGGPPLPSLRLKLLQKGLDDFEYLTMLQAAWARRSPTRSQTEAQARMREQASRMVLDINRLNSDVVELERVREEIARQIERLR